jgi:putative hydrolase of the HAD superfamily
VFDVYGTLLTSVAGEIGVDSSASRGADSVFATFAQRYGRPGSTADSIAQEFFNTIARHHARLRSRDIPQPEVDIREIWATVIARQFRPPTDAYDPEMIALEYELALNPVWPMPGAAEVIRELGAGSYNLGIVSNAQFYTPLIMEALFGAPPDLLGFRVCVWSFETGIAKPSTAIFRRFLDAAEISSPETVLYVGNDMRNDIAAAHEIGMVTALFAGDSRSLRLRENDPIAENVTPDIVLSDLRELHNALSDRTPVTDTAKGTKR